VQVYDRLIAALRDGDVRPGDAIPPEVRLAADLGVSRTVLREALRLLEEDGVLQRGADRRRRHLADPAGATAGFAAPLEEVLRVPGEPAVRGVRAEVLPATAWGARLLDVPAGSPVLVWESLLLSGGATVGSALELVPAGDPAVAGLPDPAAPGPGRGTLLAALGPQFRSRLTPSLWRLAPTATTSTRAGLERPPRGAVLGTLTTVLARHGRPVYLGKHVLRLDAVVLAVGQPPAVGDLAEALADDAVLAGG
jgi:DNA-binding GntR family transcriptional regulator